MLQTTKNRKAKSPILDIGFPIWFDLSPRRPCPSPYYSAMLFSMNIKAPSQRKEINKEKSKLDHKKRKVIINDLMMELSNKSPDLYYMPTVEVAQRIWEQLSSAEPGISKDKSELVSHLTVRDIQILLGHHSDTHDHLL